MGKDLAKISNAKLNSAVRNYFRQHCLFHKISLAEYFQCECYTAVDENYPIYGTCSATLRSTNVPYFLICGADTMLSKHFMRQANKNLTHTQATV